MLKSGITIFFIGSLIAKDFFISFDFTSKGYKLSSFHFFCSKAMTQSDANEKFIFSIDTSYSKPKEVCKKESQKIIDNLIKYKSIIYSNETLTNFSLKTRTKLSFPPKRFDIIIKNSRAYFFLKEKN